MSIILIGMPSCGKSTLGVLLAKNSGLKFIDSDLLIQEREGMLLHEIIATRGNEAFLAVEDRINASVEVENTVISTGGSAVYGEHAMQHLGEIGHVVYLKIDYETLERRLGDYSHRGVVLREGSTLRDLYAERTALYERYADVTVDERDTEGDLTKTVEKALAVCRALLKN